jgi:haloacid dehalogenase-like hydrolase
VGPPDHLHHDLDAPVGRFLALGRADHLQHVHVHRPDARLPAEPVSDPVERRRRAVAADDQGPDRRFHPEECLQLATAAEGHLPHPIARAIRKETRRRGLALAQPTAVRVLAGGGVFARVEGKEVVVGDQEVLRERGVAAPPGVAAGSSMAWIAVDGRFAASVHMRDRVKPSARDVIGRLRRTGFRRLLLATGDNPGAARPVAERLGWTSATPGSARRRSPGWWRSSVGQGTGWP